MSRRGVSCRVVPRLFATCRVTCRTQYPVKLLELLDPALNRVSIDEVLLTDLRIDGDAVEVPVFAIPLHGSDGARHDSLGKDHRRFFSRQGMARLVAFCRVIARRVVYDVVHIYSKRTTQIGRGNGGYPQYGVEGISNKRQEKAHQSHLHGAHKISFATHAVSGVVEIAAVHNYLFAAMSDLPPGTDVAGGVAE